MLLRSGGPVLREAGAHRSHVGMVELFYDLVFVFATQEAFRAFINQGWEPSGQSTLALTHGGDGKAFDGAVSVSPGVWLYQVTSSGLAAEITVKGSKYYPDKSLN